MGSTSLRPTPTTVEPLRVSPPEAVAYLFELGVKRMAVYGSVSSMLLVSLVISPLGGVYLQARGGSALGSVSEQSKRPAQKELVGAAFVPPVVSDHRGVLDRYCVTCHSERLKTGGLVLDSAGLEQVGRDAAIWEKVVRKLRTRSMPPSGQPRPTDAAYEDLASWLEDELDTAAAASPKPGPSLIRLLNRTEYANVIRDLLALEIDRTLLPADGLAYGFDNNAGLLRITPGLLERYMSAARKISRLAIGDPEARPVTELYEQHKYYEPEYGGAEGLPFATRGGLVVKHHFPLDGEYLLKVRLRRSTDENILGLFEPQQVDVRLDRERIKVFAIEARTISNSCVSSCPAGPIPTWLHRVGRLR